MVIDVMLEWINFLF